MSAEERAVKQGEEALLKAKQEPDPAKAFEILKKANDRLVDLGNPPYEPLGSIRKTMKALDTELKSKSKKQKCNYVPLSPGEIKKLKNNGYDPHDLKPKRDKSKYDLKKCKPSGKIIIQRKTKYQDPKTGKPVYPGDNDFDEADVPNINDLPWNPEEQPEEEPMQEELIIQFVVTGIDMPSKSVLKKFGPHVESWEKGHPRSPKSKLVHDESGFQVAAQVKADFEEQVEELLGRICARKNDLSKMGGQRQLQCILYLANDQRPVIHFSEAVLSQLAELKATVDVDVYYMDDKEAA